MSDKQVEAGINLDLGSGISFISYLKELKPQFLDSEGKTVLLDKRAPKTNQGPVRGEFIQADAKDIPLPKNSVSTVLVQNLFGSDTKSKPLSKEGQSSDIGDYHKIVNEITRVVRPGGRAIILETLTPPQNLSEIINYAVQSGFIVERSYGGGGAVKNLFKDPEIINAHKDSLGFVLKRK